MASENTTYVQQCLLRLRQGDQRAREDLIRAACGRLSDLTRAMLKDFRRLRRWEETDDILQSALIRLHRALGAIVPETPRDFYRLATAQIRRELIDLARHYYGPQGPARQHESATPIDNGGQEKSAAFVIQDTSLEPHQLAIWTEFHQQVDSLPAEEQEVFDLIWYQGLQQIEAAEVLEVSARTVLRRWQSACLKLHDAMQGIMPGTGGVSQ
jgi:RNA polymerase sigma-70 factor (ECF subfamily)